MGWYFGHVNNNIFQSSVSSSSFDSCTKWVGGDSIKDSKGQRHKSSHAFRLKCLRLFLKEYIIIKENIDIRK